MGSQLIMIVKPDVAIQLAENGFASQAVDVSGINNLLTRYAATARAYSGDITAEALAVAWNDTGTASAAPGTGEPDGTAPTDGTPVLADSADPTPEEAGYAANGTEEAAANETPGDEPTVNYEVPIVSQTDLRNYYIVTAPEDKLAELATSLNADAQVAGAYIQPEFEPASLPVGATASDLHQAPGSVTTANYTPRQGYLNAAPIGINARAEWRRIGGGGNGVRIIDLEWGWNLSHEDLQLSKGGVLWGTSITDPRFFNHGTAVLGEMGGDRNGLGITGICPDALISCISLSGSGTDVTAGQAIRAAANALRAGDIMLLEAHSPGPAVNFQPAQSQAGYIAIEWWPEPLAAIRYAVSLGVIVVEAAGNGAVNLDDPIYDTALAGFPAGWRNPLNVANPSSGAIIVGAGAAPYGTHGRAPGPDRSRLGFSNYGARIDAQGWGEEVTTTGYDDYNATGTANAAYTDTFGGTSGASPIVVGALASVQGILRARGMTLLTPITARQLLRTTGSPQQASASAPLTQRIGRRPDITAMIAACGVT